MTAAQISRLRWQSRRGTLELDLILEKFWRREDLHTDAHLRGLSELLALGDEELRRAVAGEKGGAGRSSAAQNIAKILRDL